MPRAAARTTPVTRISGRTAVNIDTMTWSSQVQASEKRATFHLPSTSTAYCNIALLR